MTAFEYMERQLIKHRLNFDREACRKGVTSEQLENILKCYQNHKRHKDK